MTSRTRGSGNEVVRNGSWNVVGMYIVTCDVAAINHTVVFSRSNVDVNRFE